MSMTQEVLAKARRMREVEIARTQTRQKELVRKAEAVEVPAVVSGVRPPLSDAERAKIMSLHGLGTGVVEISRTLGIHRSTVTRIIKQELDPSYVRKPATMPQLEKCQRGHSMEKYARPMKRGGRYCIECKRIRERARKSGKSGAKK